MWCRTWRHWQSCSSTPPFLSLSSAVLSCSSTPPFLSLSSAVLGNHVPPHLLSFHYPQQFLAIMFLHTSFPFIILSSSVMFLHTSFPFIILSSSWQSCSSTPPFLSLSSAVLGNQSCSSTPPFLSLSSAVLSCSSTPPFLSLSSAVLGNHVPPHLLSFHYPQQFSHFLIMKPLCNLIAKHLNSELLLYSLNACLKLSLYFFFLRSLQPQNLPFPAMDPAKFCIKFFFFFLPQLK